MTKQTVPQSLKRQIIWGWGGGEVIQRTARMLQHDGWGKIAKWPLGFFSGSQSRCCQFPLHCQELWEWKRVLLKLCVCATLGQVPLPLFFPLFFVLIYFWYYKEQWTPVKLAKARRLLENWHQSTPSGRNGLPGMPTQQSQILLFSPQFHLEGNWGNRVGIPVSLRNHKSQNGKDMICTRWILRMVLISPETVWTFHQPANTSVWNWEDACSSFGFCPETTYYHLLFWCITPSTEARRGMKVMGDGSGPANYCHGGIKQLFKR